MSKDSGVVLLVCFFLPCPQMKDVPQGPIDFQELNRGLSKVSNARENSSKKGTHQVLTCIDRERSLVSSEPALPLEWKGPSFWGVNGKFLSEECENKFVLLS